MRVVAQALPLLLVVASSSWSANLFGGADAQATSAAAVLSGCGLTLSSAARPVSNSSTVLSGFPQLLDWTPNPATLPTAAASGGAGAVLTLSWIQEGDCRPQQVARAYAAASGGINVAWESTRNLFSPLQPDCSGGGGNTCTINPSVGPNLADGSANAARGAYILEGFSRKSGPLSNGELAARFLNQATFGPTEADVAALLSAAGLTATAPADDTSTAAFSAWFTAQRALPASYLRSYLRERVNTRDQGDEFLIGRLARPCDIGSRWNRYAFNHFDAQSDEILEVNRVGSSAGTCYYSLVLKGDVVVTTVPDTFAGENCTQNLPASRLFRLCALREPTPYSYITDPFLDLAGPFQAGSVGDCAGATLTEVPHPTIEFQGGTGSTPLEAFGAGTVTMTPVVAVADSFIATARTAACSGTERKGFAFMSVGGVNYRLDRRRTLVANDLNSPALVNDPEYELTCADVDSTFANAESCAYREPASGSVCAATVYADGTSITLDDTHLGWWYTDNERYVYNIQNLRFDTGASVRPPCRNNEISRWIRTPGACAGNPWNNQVAIDAVRAAAAGATANPDVVDVDVSDFGSCPEDTNTLGAEVEVDGSCWKHSHPNERDVIDFTQWVSEHPGGAQRIKQFAQAGGTTIYFPASHPMSRFRDTFQLQRSGYHANLGRLGDVVEFSALPKALQTPEMAARVGATQVASGTGFLSCGSRAEGASVPTLGHRFIGKDRDIAQGLDRRYSDYIPSTTGAYAFYGATLEAQDQLRHKVAWALGQIVVMNGDGFLGDNGEPTLHFHDIFIEHAFGNYRDILREVSVHPAMGSYLTFVGNRAFAVSGTYPDENYAREVMQLFSVGVFEVEEDGIESRDANGEFKLTYSNTDIENGARTWTGFERRDRRNNLIFMSRTQGNYIDPMRINVNNRDRFPKTRLAGAGGGYLGDGYPLCSDLPARHFLMAGAKYTLVGENSDIGAFYDEIAGKAGSVARDHFNPTTGPLFTALCGAAAACTFPGAVELPATIACTGEECNMDTLRTVKITSSSGNSAYYKYHEPACVYLSFFDDGRIIKNSGAEQCAAPGAAISAGVTCCSNTTSYQVLSNGGGECKYLAEPMRYETAEQRCTATHGPGATVCPTDNWALEARYPFRDGYTGVTPSVPTGVTIRKARDAEISGTYGGATRWRVRINATTADRSGAGGPLVLSGLRPDGATREFTVERVQYWSYNGDYMYFVPFPTQAQYEALGDAALAQFNLDFPVGTEFSVARMGYGPDPTGELGTSERWSQFCAAWQFQWSPDTCEMVAEVDGEGRVSLVDPRGSTSSDYGHLRWLREGSGNKFVVEWNAPRGTVAPGELNFPRVDPATGLCDTMGCTNNSDSCVCPILVENSAAYTDASANVESPTALRSRLKIGAFAPGAGYTRCTTAPCTSQADVEVWTTGSATPAAFDVDTIFVLNDLVGWRSQARYLKNVESTVLLGTAATDEVQVTPESCTASSFYNDDDRYNCSKAYDGNIYSDWASNREGVGAWIDLQFGGRTVTLDRFRIANRCASGDRNIGIRLSFSDQSSQTFALNNETCDFQNLALTSVATTFVRITVESVNSASTTGMNNGAREIEFFGPAGPNARSATQLHSFRNAPQFVPNAGAFGRTRPDNSPRFELYGWDYWADKAMDETDALLDSLLEHPNTPVMIASQLIQKLVTSNPSPRYVRECGRAFKTGTYGSLSFSGEFGDLGATVACILLDREARVSALDLDHKHGKIQESLLKVMHMQRSIEFAPKPGKEAGLQNMQSLIGQGAMQYPSVFSFVSPFYEPQGKVADNGLVSPEAQILAAPEVVNFLNGMDSLVDNGLTYCDRGFGDNYDAGNKRNYCRSQSRDTSDDGRLEYALPARFADVEYVPASLSASIEPSPVRSQSCLSAIDLNPATREWISDRNEQVGAWIEAFFSGPTQIDTIHLMNRCGGNDLKNQDVRVTFGGDNSTRTFTMQDNCLMMNFSLGAPLTVTSVRVETISTHQPNTNQYNGYRQFEFTLGGDPTRIAPTSCSASSENGVGRGNSCSLSVGSGVTEGWSVQANGLGSWVQANFATATTIGRVSANARCGPERPRSVRLEFSDGSSQVIEMANDCEADPVPIAEVTTSFVKATIESTYNATLSDCCDCGRYMRRYNLTAAPSGVPHEAYRPGEDAELRFFNSRQKDEVVDTVATLLAPGRLTDIEREVIGDAYEREGNQNTAFHKLLKLFSLSTSFHINNDPAPLALDRVPYVPPPSQNRQYKAVITVLLAGGADSYNMLVPHTCSPTDLYGEYATIRQVENAIPRADLLEIETGPESPAQPCETFGLHPLLSYVRDAYEDREAILFANMGAMVEPINTYSEYRSRTKEQPVGNFGHNGMQRNAMSMDASDHLAKGVLGRSVGVLNGGTSSYKSALYSLVGQVKIVEGSLTPAMINANSGVVRYTELSQLKSDLDKLHAKQHGSVFGETFSSILDESLSSTETLGTILEITNLTTNEANWPTCSLARQLREVARIIKVDNANLDMERSGFIVNQGGYDTHATFDLDNLMTCLSDALRAFSNEMKAQGLWENVAVHVVSDFGRTLSHNGQGTDHAWGGNYMLLGGGVRGGQILGKFPDHLNAGNILDMGRGRLLPTTPYEASWNGICEWWGVPAGDMLYVLPNKDNFPAGSLYTAADLFGECQNCEEESEGAESTSEIIPGGVGALIGIIIGVVACLALVAGLGAFGVYKARQRGMLGGDGADGGGFEMVGGSD